MTRRSTKVIVTIVVCLSAAAYVVIGLAVRTPYRAALCHKNLIQVGLGVMMYTGDYDGRLPPTRAWMDLTEPYTENPSLYQCPEATAADPGAIGFALNPAIISQPDLALGAVLPMVYDSRLTGRNAFGPYPDALPVPARHGGRHNNVCFADGHVKSVPAVP